MKIFLKTVESNNKGQWSRPVLLREILGDMEFKN